MLAALKGLSDAEVEAMLRAPLLVCILIASADGKVDRKEMEVAVALSRKKTERARKKGQLFGFYKTVGEDFEDKLKIVKFSLPIDVRERKLHIVNELKQLNEILPKLDKVFAMDFHASLKHIAAEIAKASGGLLGMKSVGEREEKYVDLPMVKAPA